MKILAKYVTNKYIDIFVEGVTPSDPQWEAARMTLEKAKFRLEGFAYRRTFDNTDEFAKWLKNTTKLTTQFGGTEPQQVQDPMQNLLEMINELHQEVVSLKKFDISAQEKLSELRSKLEQVDKKPPAKRRKK